jgi:hypothetical protein
MLSSKAEKLQNLSTFSSSCCIRFICVTVSSLIKVQCNKVRVLQAYPFLLYGCEKHGFGSFESRLLAKALDYMSMKNISQ